MDPKAASGTELALGLDAMIQDRALRKNRGTRLQAIAILFLQVWVLPGCAGSQRFTIHERIALGTGSAFVAAAGAGAVAGAVEVGSSPRSNPSITYSEREGTQVASTTLLLLGAGLVVVGGELLLLAVRGR